MILNNDTTPRRARTLPLLASAGAVLTMALAAAEPRAAAAAASGPAAAGQPVPSCQSDWVDAAGAPAGAAADLGGRMEYRERIDERGYTRSIVKGFGDLRLCLFAEDTGDARRPSEIARRAARVVLEARQAGVVQQLELTKAGATWRVNGAIPPSDAVAAEWRQHLLGVLDATWDLAAIRGDARVRQDDWRTGELEARRQADLARLLTIVEGKGASPAGARPSAQ